MNKTYKNFAIQLQETLNSILSLSEIMEKSCFEEIKNKANAIFEKYKECVEAYPVKWDENQLKITPFYFIIEDKHWIPVRDGDENHQGGLNWNLRYTEHAESGSSRACQWCHCDADGNPCINLTLEEFLAINPMYLKSFFGLKELA